MDDDGFVGTVHHYWMYAKSMSIVDWGKTVWMVFVCGMVLWFVLTAILSVAQERASRMEKPNANGKGYSKGAANGAAERRAGLPKLKISGRLPLERRASGACAHELGGESYVGVDGGDEEEGGFSPPDERMQCGPADRAGGQSSRSASRSRRRWNPPDATPTRVPISPPPQSAASWRNGRVIPLDQMPEHQQHAGGMDQMELPSSPVEASGASVGHSVRQRSLQDKP